MAQRLASVTQQLEMERTKTHQVVQQERTKSTQLELQVRLQCLADWHWGQWHACRCCLTCCRQVRTASVPVVWGLPAVGRQCRPAGALAGRHPIGGI